VKPVAEVGKISEAEEQKAQFVAKMFEHVSQKWVSTVKQNEEHFNKGVQQL
jgi:hypothetical protein